MIWVPDKEQEWILGEIIEDHGETVSVNVTPYSKTKTLFSSLSGTATPIEAPVRSSKDVGGTAYNRRNLCEFDATHDKDLDDLCLLNNLHEGPLIHILRRRWLQDRIYTYAGDILISINPYKLIPGLYDDPLSYYHTSTDVKRNPHVFAVANEALRKLAATQNNDKIVNQSVIISGESGAGKTEASKYMINFLIRVNESLHVSSFNNRINDIVANSNTIFEAFGNAKSVQNDNASRFGKYMKLQYTATNELVSTANETFLLEKSRLVNTANQERNYHVLYYFVRGMELVNSKLKEELALAEVETFKILTDGGCTIIREASTDATAFVALNAAIRNIGYSEEDINSLWGVLAAILHLGNTVVTEPLPDQELPKVGVQITSCSLALVAGLLGVEDFELLKALTTQQVRVVTRMSVKEKPLSVKDTRNSVLALIKRLYHAVFTWLVNTINSSTASIIPESEQLIAKYIGILDICGFEIIPANSFEQLCINFTNERLQHQFNDSVFASEQELYQREGINWTTISYQDNQNVIDLIAKKPTGLLNLLEEHCQMNRPPDDLMILGLYHQNHGDRPDKLYAKPRFSKDPTFILKHFAGNVTYQIDGFIAKNYDSLQEDLTHLLQDSDNKFVAMLMSINEAMSGVIPPASTAATTQAPTRRASKVASLSTVSSSVRSQLDALINALKVTEPHFVKVLKPNNEKLPDVFDTPSTMTQLRYSDIIEVVRIRRERFQVRMSFREFYQLYEIFGRSHRDWKPPSTCSDEEAKQYAHVILSRYLTPDNYQFGKTMVFIRERGLSGMQIAASDYLNISATMIQKTFRRWQARNTVQELLLIARQLRQDEESQQSLRELQEKIAQEKMKLQAQMDLQAEILQQRQVEEENLKKRAEELEAEKAKYQSLLEERRQREEHRRMTFTSRLKEAQDRLEELLRLVAEQRALIAQIEEEEAQQLVAIQQNEEEILASIRKQEEEEAQHQAMITEQLEKHNQRLAEEQRQEELLRQGIGELEVDLGAQQLKMQEKKDEIMRQLEARKNRATRHSSK
jgi:myosin V